MVSAKALRWEQVDLLIFLPEGRKMEYLLLCLQSVSTGHVIAWDIAFFLGGQGSSPPPFPRPEGQEGTQGSGGQKDSPDPLGPLSLGLEYPQPQEAGRVEGRTSTVPAPSTYPMIRVEIFTIDPSM